MRSRDGNRPVATPTRDGEQTGASAGVIDQADYLVLKNNFLAQWAPAAQSGIATPEPACWVQLLAATGVAVAWPLRHAKPARAATD